ncbi:hypothetical protein QUB19_02565 [Microcoleus sp. B4-C5]|uniref:hypothetical protein n=1 Tax=unclassified Microcoleus TaxID=2642155 RepID=UPI002FD7035A
MKILLKLKAVFGSCLMVLQFPVIAQNLKSERHIGGMNPRSRTVAPLSFAPDSWAIKASSINDRALRNQGIKKITLKSKSFVDTGFYDGHI